MSAVRKVFNCVVDDTALTANISEIKKWTAQDAVKLIIPLYTLERLRAPKDAGPHVRANAREAVRLLDRVTSGKHNISADKVTLQGPLEQFETWEEAQRFILPEFIYNEHAIKKSSGEDQADSALVATPESKPKPKSEPKQAEHGKGPGSDMQGLNEMSRMLLGKLNFKKEPDSASVVSVETGSVPSSPTSGGSRASPECSSRNLESSGEMNNAADDTDKSDHDTKFVIPAVPEYLKPLLNATLWRLHKLSVPASDTNSCILVTNDRVTQAWAQKFGITVKNVPQLRTLIIYEDKEFKNHCKYLEKNQPAEQPKPLLSYEEESDEEVLVFVPRRPARGGAQPWTGRSPKRGGAGPSSRLVNGNNAGHGRNRALSAAADSKLEVPSSPIDPDSFNRNMVTTNQTGITTSPNSPPYRSIGTAATPRGNGGRRGPSRGGMSRGTTRGRGKLWIP
ncbi:hypothetical protein FQN57_002611 [Myotisia sp. PD_48]|nr:hypothetical protein FQN57_002611 [Myotisia sp. PD_48]